MKINLAKLTGNSESETLELKESFSNEALESIGAFANAQGGTLLVGVRNNGKIIGVTVGANTLEEWAQKIQAKMQPRILTSMRVEEFEGTTVGIIKVDHSQSPVSVDGRFFKRVGRTNQLMSHHEIMYAALNSSNTSWDKQIEEGSGLRDLDEKLIAAFLSKINQIGRRTVSTSDPWQETLEKLELLVDGKPTRAAILLFGTNVKRFFPSAYLKVGRFKTQTLIIDDIEFDGPLFEQLDQAMTWFKARLSLKFIITNAALEAGNLSTRGQEWEYPLSALREGVLNAICHRDYKIGTDTSIRLYDDHVEIWNAGTLPPALTVADLTKPHKSIPHNKLIAEAFYYTGDIEKWGSGTTRMAEELKQHKLQEPEFDASSPHFFKLTISKRLQQNKLSIELNNRQTKALEHLKTTKRLTSTEYQELNNTSKATAKRDLAILIDQGMLIKSGSGKLVEYRLPVD
ncbi:putative DNA binding domain-containing protein [bacterium]|jgi:ATP-dependent DNA helicase RecG|nr:putative DNA binding domain-containing protein [bacterium]